MTLIVAKIFNEKVLIFADTKVNDPLNSRRSPLQGALKIIISNPHLAIGYAGVISFAERAIKQTLYFESIPVNEVLLLLAEANKESNDQTEFIVATLSEGPRMYKISGGEIEEGLTSAWIGSHAAFARYQQEYGLIPDETAIPERMAEAFQRVLSGGSINDVGGFPIVVHIHPELDRPMLVYHTSLRSCNPEEFSVGNDWTSMPLGTVEGGAFCVSQLRTVNLKRHGVALHFSPGNFGVLFCPQINFDPIHIMNATAPEFVQIIKREYDLTLEGFIPLNDIDSVQVIGPSVGETLTPWC